MAKHKESVDSQIFARIKKHGRGWVFSPAEFLDLGSRNAVASTLKRMKALNTIRQLARGLYDYPRQDDKLGLLSPTTDSVAKTLKERDDTRLQPSGAHAANILGLSTQVPIRTVYLTDGRARKVVIGKRQILLKHTSPRQMATAGRISGTVIQALRWLGQGNMDDNVIAILKRRLSKRDKHQLLEDIRYAPTWATEIIRKVANKD
jgi:Family of unknown function (DUF6088)